MGTDISTPPGVGQRKKTPATRYERVVQSLRVSAFSPTWLPSPWNKPPVGYGCAVCLPLVMTLFTLFVLHIFPTFALKGVFAQSTTLVVALLWGTGPGLVATLLSALLLNFALLPPPLVVSASPQALVETGAFLAFGIAICLVVSRIEYARSEAEQARERREHFAQQLERERAQVANRASELEAIFAAMTDGIYVYDKQRRVIRSNPAARMFNPFTAQDDYRSRPFLERIAQFQLRDTEGNALTEENLPIVRVLSGEALTGAQTVDIVMHMTEGEDRFYNVTGAPIRGDGGSIQGGVVVMRDVTERKRLEQESTARAQQLQALFEAVPDAITVFDREGRIVQMNGSAQHLLARFTNLTQAPIKERLSGLDAQDTGGDVLGDENAPTSRLLRGETLTGVRAQSVTVKTFDGDSIWLNVAGAPLYDEEGRVSGAVALTRDETEQHLSSQRTREILQALLHFAEALVQGGLTQEPGREEENQGASDPDARLDQVAHRLVQLMSQVTGFPRVSLTTFGQHINRPLAKASVGLSAEQMRAWRMRRSGHIFAPLLAGTELGARIEAGEVVVVDLTQPPFTALLAVYGPTKMLMVPMRLEGKVVGGITFDACNPASEYRDEDIALARALAQLAALTIERARLFEERAQAQATLLALREANRLMDEFIGIAGHELRTPITTIQASVQLARRQVNRVLKQREGLPTAVTSLITSVGDHLDRTERQIRMQSRLISDLLDVARIHAARLELYPELCDLAVIVRECVEDQRYLTPSRNIRLSSNVSEEVLVMADPDRLRQVVGNYLSNALKYSETDKPVEARIETEGGVVRVAVRDEGPGLSEQEQERIWQRFYRVPGMTVKSGSGVGLGLGLHISRTIIERLGGHVGVQSVLGTGSTFWFTLPLAEHE